MTKTEMLLKLLDQSGYKVTTDTDEDGYRICIAKADDRHVCVTQDEG